MKIIFGLGHPAHFHLFKNVIKQLLDKGHDVVIVINDKEILSRLMDDAGFHYHILTVKGIEDTLTAKLKKLGSAIRQLRKLIKEYKPDVLAGCTNEIAIASTFTGIPVLFFAEDDFTYTWIQGLTVYPFVTRIVSPAPVNVGPFKYKKSGYNGFQKLAYLHPAWFTPDRSKVRITEEKYFIIRLVGMNAYHDFGKKGMDQSLLPGLIEILTQYGRVFITSEKPIDAIYEKYRLVLNPSDMHHYLAFASMFVSDSQSMTVEAALLGTPNIRISDFAGRVSVLEVLEKKYGLTAAFKPDEPDKVLDLVKEWVKNEKLQEEYTSRRIKMLADMVDVTEFIVNQILLIGEITK
jgi:uncharacterized protein